MVHSRRTRAPPRSAAKSEDVDLLAERLADGPHVEADLLELRDVEDVAPVEDEGGLLHRVEDALVVKRLEGVPLGEDGDGVRAGAGDVRVVLDLDLLHRVLAEVRVDLLA